MNVEEIKKNNPMPEVMARYGIDVRRNMCRCPFHEDKNASMKVFKDGAHCFTCAKSWDVLSFVQDMEHCDFKTAYYELGGVYEHKRGDGELLRRSRRQREIDRQKQAERDRRDRLKELYITIDLCKILIKQEPLSQAWTDGYNYLQMIDRIIERGEEDITQYEFIKCVKLRQKYIVIN